MSGNSKPPKKKSHELEKQCHHLLEGKIEGNFEFINMVIVAVSRNPPKITTEYIRIT